MKIYIYCRLTNIEQRFISRIPFPMGNSVYKHVITPFNIRQNRESFSRENVHILHGIFPSTVAISLDDTFLIFCVETLPPKPWPQTVAGMPPYFTTEQMDVGPICSTWRFSRSRIRFFAELDGGYLTEDVYAILDLAKAFFDQEGIAITELQYWDNCLVIILEHKDADLAQIPRSIAQCPCFYLFEEEMSRPKNLHARGNKEPLPNEFDNSRYDVLRAGVMLSSAKSPDDGSQLLTSSGVLVQDRLGDQYMTVSAHGFPSATDTAVYHPTAEGKQIGQLLSKAEVPALAHTGLSLVKLHDGITYINETFESAAPAGSGDSPAARLKGFARTGSTSTSASTNSSSRESKSRPNQNERVYMNSPFVGQMEGFRHATALMRVPVQDDNEGNERQQQQQEKWIKTFYLYMGQGFGELFPGAVAGSGSAIWNGEEEEEEEEEVVVFLVFPATPSPRARGRTGRCGVSADHLVEAGYSLVVPA